MSFFLTNFDDKLSIYTNRMTAECSPQLFAKLVLFHFMLMPLNHIRVPRAIFLRERYAQSPKIEKSTLFSWHAIKHLYRSHLVLQ